MPILVIGERAPVLEVRKALRAGARAYGLIEDYVDAIGRVETEWDNRLVNQIGPDAARGGAFGPTQATLRTLRALGYRDDPARLCLEPLLAGEWTGRILADALRKVGKDRFSTLADYVGAWNAGKYDADRNNDGELEELPPDHPTRTTYLPRAKKALVFVHAHPVA